MNWLKFLWRKVAGHRTYTTHATYMSYVPYESHVATLEQLSACRAVLAATMLERDQYDNALRLACEQIVDLRREREAEREAARYWITRTIAPQEVSEN